MIAERQRPLGPSQLRFSNELEHAGERNRYSRALSRIDQYPSPYERHLARFVGTCEFEFDEVRERGQIQFWFLKT